jgi:hypothetical protein
MNGPELVREKQINVRLNAEELERLDRVAAHYGLSGPNTLRLLLKAEDDRLRREAVAPPKSRKR